MQFYSKTNHFIIRWQTESHWYCSIERIYSLYIIALLYDSPNFPPSQFSAMLFCSWAMWPIFSLFQINYVYVWFYRKSVSIIVNEWVHSCQKTSCNCSISVQSSIYFNVIWPRSENRKFGFKTAWAKYSYEPTQSNGICVRNPLNKNIKEFWVVARRLQTWKFMFPFAFIYDTVEKWTLLFYGSHKGSYINDSIWFSIFFLLLFR